MASWIYAEGVLVGPGGVEITHPNYKRKSVVISVEHGFHGEVMWEGLNGAEVWRFQLRILENVFIESVVQPLIVGDWGTIVTRLDILGKAERKLTKEN